MAKAAVNKCKVPFPSEEKLKQIRKESKKWKGSYVLPVNASAVDQAKYDVCEKILIYKQRKELSQRELAAKMEIPETRVSEIVHYRIWKFTLDRLMDYYQKINPKAVLRVA